MSARGLLVALALVLGLRVVACGAHEHPRGDVLLDVGVTRSLASGDGYASGFERGLVRVAGADAPVPPQGRADQHPPLWPSLGALPAALGAPPFAALKWIGLLASLALLPLVLRVTDRLLESVVGASDALPAWAAIVTGLAFVSVDAGGNGSLYAAQALGVLLLVEALAAARPSVLACGALLGALALLNHQCLVLAPLPLLVLLGRAPRGARAAALARASGVLLVAALVQLPWWWRNARVFGDPFFSVNELYLLYRAGVDTRFVVEQGLPVLRLIGDVGPADLPRVLLANLRQNLPWMAAALPLATAGLLAPLLAGAPALLDALRRRRDPRLLGLLGASALLLGAALLWPATKLRYLVPLVPLLVPLAARALAHGPTRVTRGLAWGVAVLWIALLALTADDVLGSGADAHPARWGALAGAALLALLFAAGASERRWARVPLAASAVALLLSGSLAVQAARHAADPGARPGTAYHSTWFLPDVFGQDAELAQERRADAVARLLAARAGPPARVLGPLELLAYPGPRLVELPTGLPAAILGPVVASWTAPDAARLVDELVLTAADELALFGPPDAAPAPAVEPERLQRVGVAREPGGEHPMLFRYAVRAP